MNQKMSSHVTVLPVITTDPGSHDADGEDPVDPQHRNADGRHDESVSQRGETCVDFPKPDRIVGLKQTRFKEPEAEGTQFELLEMPDKGLDNVGCVKKNQSSWTIIHGKFSFIAQMSRSYTLTDFLDFLKYKRGGVTGETGRCVLCFRDWNCTVASCFILFLAVLGFYSFLFVSGVLLFTSELLFFRIFIPDSLGTFQGVRFIHILAIIMIVLGTVTCIMGMMGLIGVLFKLKTVLVIYSYFLFFMFAVQLLTASMCFFLNEPMLSVLKRDLVAAIHVNYDGRNNSRNAFSLAIDITQVRLKCCGVFGPEDFKPSLWNRYSNKARVPFSCCRLSDEDAFFSQKIYILDDRSCPFSKPGGNNLYTSFPCPEKMKDLNEMRIKLLLFFLLLILMCKGAAAVVSVYANDYFEELDQTQITDSKEQQL